MIPITRRPTGRLSLLKILMAGLLLAASPVQGMVYMWRDSAGIAHYTNKEYDVPARYKAKAKALYPEASDSGAVQSSTANAQAAPVAPPAAASQSAGPEGQPAVRSAVPAAQIQSTLQKAPERRSRRQRERSAAEDE